MTQQPLTPSGVADKLDEVYALSTHDRLAQAALVESGFKTWVSDNFILSGAQATFLSGMNSTVVAEFGKCTATCFRHQLGIALVIPMPKIPPVKWIKLTNNLLFATDENGAEEVTGSLTFAYEYR